MIVVCHQCQTQNKAGARYCSRCGTTLPEVVPSSAARLAPASAAEPSLASPPTHKLVEPPRLSSLPPGELVKDDRYEILSIVDESHRYNTYIVRDRKLRRCTNCGRTDDPDSRFCENCGAALHENVYALRESYDPRLLSGEHAVLRHGFVHPTLVNLYDAWTGRPYRDQDRGYAIFDPILLGTVKALPRGAPPVETATPLASLLTQPREQVLAWAEEIAALLDDLHSQGLHLPGLGDDMVWLVDDHTGRKPRVAAAEQIVEMLPEDRAETIEDDIRNLARLIGGLLADEEMPPRLAQALERLPAEDALRPLIGEAGTAAAFVAALRGEEATTPAAPDEPLAPIRTTIAFASDVGRVREVNEDGVLVLTMDQALDSQEYGVRLAALADGMGGHSAGEIASRLALNMLARRVSDALFTLMLEGREPGESTFDDTDFGELLRQATVETAAEVHAEARRLATDMGTTLVAALIVGPVAHIVNVGDSRLYRLDQETITQITSDHSLAELLISRHGYTPDEARDHPQANQLYRSIGNKAHVEVDAFRTLLRPGDSLLLCSDGLSGLVPDMQIFRIVQSAESPQAACDELVQTAWDAGGHDNISVVLVRAEAAG